MSKQQSSPTSSRKDVIVGSSELAELIRQFDWKNAGLPPIEQWDHTLLTTVNLILQSPVPIVILWGADGVLLYNDAYSVFAAQRHPQLLGSKVVEGWPEVADFNRHVMDVVYHNAKSLSYKAQNLVLHRNNKPEHVWMDLDYSPVFDESAKPAGVFAVVTEKTEGVLAEQGREKAEEELRAERERLKSLFAQAPAMIAVLRGPNHVFEMANPLYRKTVAPNRTIVGKPIAEALPELNDQGIVEILDTVLETGEAYKGVLSFQLDRYGTGELEDAYFSLVYQPISSRIDGVCDGIFVHAVEVTDHIRSRERSERLSAELSAVFESLPDGIYITDTEKITHINKRGAQILGYDSPDDVPRELDKFYEGFLIQYDIKDQFEKVNVDNTTLGRALRGETVSNVAVRIGNKETGTKKTIRSAAAPILDDSGNILGAVATTSDMTEQYELQAQIQKEVIRRKVLSQKARLLKEQNEQLTILNETKDEFIALTSHQLRTPATGVKQYVGMLLQGFAGDLPDNQREFLQRAYESNDRQLYIIDDILRVARIDLDQIKLQRHRQDIVAFIRNIVAEQSNKFVARKQTVDIVTTEPSIEVRFDTGNLGMALGNIIDNASKYTPDGKKISIVLTKNKKRCEIAVRDEGVGIDEKDYDRLFQKFSRLPNERSIAVGGTGLGLYLAKKMIEKHKGTIDVKSAPDQGTIFTISLPL